MGLNDHLLRVAHAYAHATGRKLSYVSRLCAGSWGFLQKLGAGQCDISVSRYERILAWFRTNWPAGTAWPSAPREIIVALDAQPDAPE